MQYEYGEDFQRRVVALLLQDPTCIVEIGDVVKSSYFTVASLRTVVELALTFAASYGASPRRETMHLLLDAHAVQYELLPEEVERLQHTIAQLYDAEVPDAPALRDMVVEFGAWAAMQGAIQYAAESLTRAKNVRSAQEEIRRVVEQALYVGQGHSRGIQVFDYLEDPRKSLTMSPLADPKRRVPTGIPTLDAYLEGGLGPGELGVVGGESGVGKSQLVNFISTSAIAAGKRGLYISCELKPHEQLWRAIACATGVPSSRFLYGGTADTKDYLIRSREFVERSSKYLRIEYFPPGTASVSDLRALLSRLRRRDNITFDYVIVDYADELRPSKFMSDGKGETSMYLAYGGVYDELIKLGVDFEVAVWTPSQVNRSGYGTDGSSRNVFSDSMKKLFKADVALILSQSKEERETTYSGLPVCHLTGTKLRRGGPSGWEIGMTAHAPTNRFVEIDGASWATIKHNMYVEQKARAKQMAVDVAARVAQMSGGG